MKNSILNLGKALNKAEQKIINGGTSNCRHMEKCFYTSDCGPKDCVLICIVGRCRAY